MEKTKGFIGEFKEFISRGNVMDIAVGMIIGAAFTAIVKSLVDDIVMPVIGIIVGGINFSELKYVIREATATTPAATLNYGLFIQNVINFLLISLVIFIFIKAINRFKKKEEEAPAEPAADVKLLTEIRDLLADKKEN